MMYVITFDYHRNHHFKYKMTRSGLLLVMIHLQFFSSNNIVMYVTCLVVGMDENHPLKPEILVVMMLLYIVSTIT